MNTSPSIRLSALFLVVAALNMACVQDGSGGWKFAPSDPSVTGAGGGDQPSGTVPDNSGPNADPASWAKLKANAIARVQVAPGWGKPQLAPGDLNSLGWEDSADISGDGKTIHIAYISADFYSWFRDENGHPGRFAQFQRGPDRGNKPPFSIDSLESKLVDGKWTAPVPHKVTRDADPFYLSETGVTEAQGSVWYTSNHPCTDSDYDPDVWRDGECLPFNTEHDEEDPTYRDGSLFFWSEHRPAAGGKKVIFESIENGDDWSKPKPVPAPINTSGSSNWQPYMDAKSGLWFTSDRGGSIGIWRSQRGADGKFAKPVRMIWANPGDGLLAVAEPSVTDDGKTACFVVLFQDASGGHELDVALVSRTD
jgi:hypothetical protein